MHLRFLDYLADPITKKPFSIEVHERDGDLVMSGTLQSKTASYPIVGGVPRFVSYENRNYAHSFAWQWRRWPRLQFEIENEGKPMSGYTRRMWERITGFEADHPFTTDDVVLDMGCGPGRFSDVTRAKGATVIALDYSAAADVAAKNLGDGAAICVVQGDALNLPVRNCALSGAFSIGVLHHTPDPARGVREAVGALAPGGWFSVSVYARGGYYDFPTVHFWRRTFGKLWPVFHHYPALAYSYFAVYTGRPIRNVPVLGRAVRVPLPAVQLPDREWSLLDTFDSITPSYQSGHDTFEVFTWLRNAGFKDIRPSDWGPTSFSGSAPDAEATPFREGANDALAHIHARRHGDADAR